MTSSLAEVHSPFAPPLRVAVMPTPDRVPARQADARAALATAHQRLLDKGWAPQGLAYDLVFDCGVTVAALLVDVGRWREAGRETLFAPITGPDGRTLLQPYTRAADPHQAQREAWARETALPFGDADAHRVAELVGGA